MQAYRFRLTVRLTTICAGLAMAQPSMAATGMTILGTILDAANHPVAHAEVACERFSSTGDPLDPSPFARGYSGAEGDWATVADDVTANINAGEKIVCSVPDASEPTRVESHELAFSNEIVTVDFHVASGPLIIVSGTVRNQAGQVAPQSQVQCQIVDGSGTGASFLPSISYSDASTGGWGSRQTQVTDVNVANDSFECIAISLANPSLQGFSAPRRFTGTVVNGSLEINDVDIRFGDVSTGTTTTTVSGGSTTTSTTTTLPPVTCDTGCVDGDACTTDVCEGTTCTNPRLTGVAGVACLCQQALPNACTTLPKAVTNGRTAACRPLGKVTDASSIKARRRALAKASKAARKTANGVRRLVTRTKLSADCGTPLGAQLDTLSSEAVAARP